MSDQRNIPTEGEDPADEVQAAGGVERGVALGRFQLLGPLGVGGVGVVLLAYDPQLDRKVALKLLRSDVFQGERARDGRAALVREAQAMARLHHPNVVAVHEVAEVGDAVYLVMEYVEGSTLRGWMDGPRRDWREVLAMLTEVGRGLAAAHRAGLVHRDFKPENALIGEDGRPRVSDFGLASGSGSEGSGGTPAYMAPEQVAKQPVDARADVYAFAVTLWEALYGARPGRELVVPRDRDVPAWLHRAILRGLAANPDERWPTIADFLDALRHRGPLRVGLAVAGAAVLIAVAFAAFTVGRQDSRPAPCAGGEQRVASLWDDAARARVHQAFQKTAGPVADDAFARLDGTLRARLSAWADAHREACEATHVRHEQSEALLDLRMRCLDRAKVEIGALIGLLPTADRDGLEHAMRAAAGAGDIASCADATAVRAAVPLPAPEVADEVAQVESAVLRLSALRRLGDWKTGLAEAPEVVARARRVGYLPVLATALLQTGELEDDGRQFAAAADHLYEAIHLGAQAHDDDLVAEATAAVMVVVGVHQQSVPGGDVAQRLAIAATARAGETPARLARLNYSRARLLRIRGEYGGSLLLFQAALAFDEALHGRDSLEVAIDLGDVGAGMQDVGQKADSKGILERALATMEKIVGPDHQLVATLLHKYGMTLDYLGEYDGAATAVTRAIAINERVHGPDDVSVAILVRLLAIIRVQQGKTADGRALLERAIHIFEVKSPANPNLAGDYANLAGLEETAGHYDVALQLCLKGRAIVEKTLGAEHPAMTDSYQREADILRRTGRLVEAHAAIQHAVDIDKKTIGEDNSGHADVLLELADILVDEKRPAEAVAVYRRALALQEGDGGAESPVLADVLSRLCKTQLEANDAAGALASGRRAFALAGTLPADAQAAAQFCSARAEWMTGDHAHALTMAREARTKLAALPSPPAEGSVTVAVIDQWLVGR